VARQFSQGWEPRLLVIIDGILPLEPILDGLKTLAAEQVPTRIQVKVEFLSGVSTRFEREQGDLMLVGDSESRPFLDEQTLPDMECVLCVAAAHPLAKKSRFRWRSCRSMWSSPCRTPARSSARTCTSLAASGAFTCRASNQEAGTADGCGFWMDAAYLIRDELKVGGLRK